MKAYDILDALGDVSAEYISEAETEPKKKMRPAWIRYAAAAACVCLLAGAGIAVFPKLGRGKPHSHTVEPQFDRENGVTIPIPELTLNKETGSAACMVGFFFHDGRYYQEYEFGDTTWNVGDYVCSSTGLIDEWTSAEGYVDGAGSSIGDYYAVEGYDPDFLLCQYVEGYDISALFVNNRGLHLIQGSQILASGFHITGEETDIRWLSQEDWYYDSEDWKTMQGEVLSLAHEVFDGLMGAPFVYTEDIPYPEDKISVYDALERFHVVVMTEGGVPVHLRLFEGGYVMVDAFYDVCLRVQDNHMAQYEALLAALNG